MRADNLAEIVDSIDCSECSHAEWVAVGMGLKHEAYPFEVWDDWSRRDSQRYHEGETARRWASFRGSGTPVTAGSIVHIAREHGWEPAPDMGRELAWDDCIGAGDDWPEVTHGDDEWDLELGPEDPDDDMDDSGTVDLIVIRTPPGASSPFMAVGPVPAETVSTVNPHTVGTVAPASDVRTVADIAAALVPGYATPRDYYVLEPWGIRLRPGGVTIIGARPGVGKSAFAVQEAQALAERGVRCRIYSFEMSDEEWIDRLIARNVGLAADELDAGIPADQLAQIADTLSGEWTRQVEIVDSIGWSIEKVIGDMHYFAERGGQVAFVDYLQLMTRQVYDDVTEASRRLKIAARQTGLAVVPLSQLSRTTDKEGKLRTPALTDLRQSGALEQDADCVVLLHAYDEIDRKTAARKAVAQSNGYLVNDPAYDGMTFAHVDIAKNRRGPANVLHLAYFDGRGQTWHLVDQVIDDDAHGWAG